MSNEVGGRFGNVKIDNVGPGGVHHRLGKKKKTRKIGTKAKYGKKSYAPGAEKKSRLGNVTPKNES